MLAIGPPDDPADNPRVTDLSRYADFLSFLDEQHAADPDLRAAWVGGSAATGGYDEWSDLDVEVLCAPGTYLDVYRRLLAAIRERFAPPDVWELLESTYPDGRQCFVTLDPAPGALAAPTRLVDFVVWETTDEHRHKDVRRHGSPIVLFDPDGLVVERHDDEEDRRRAIEESVAQVRAQRPFGEWLVNRAIERGHLPEAVSLYLRFALQPAVYLVRVRDCYARHNFGLRYLDTDIDPGDAARVDALLPGVERLRELSAECFAWQDELLKAASD
jgi:predicted nucleotidyltransferase